VTVAVCALAARTRRRFRFPGRKPLDPRNVLTGILFVLKTGIAWDDLAAEFGCGCGKTCHHYVRLWYRAGVWQRLYAVLLREQTADQAIPSEHAVKRNAELFQFLRHSEDLLAGPGERFVRCWFHVTLYP
jgi:transposase